MSRTGLASKTLNFSIQDTNHEVLKNINRPDVGWDVHLSMANELQKTYPHQVIKGQLIYGLPGQTVVTWRQTLEQVTQANILPVIFLNEPLPASPAIYDPEYQNKFKFEYLQSNRILVDKIYSSLIPKKSSSFDQSDIVQMNLLSQIYIALSAINLGLKENMSQPLETSKLVDKFLNSQQYKNLHNNLYHNWTVENNFYYTINFSGEPVQLADVALWQSFIREPEFIKFITQEVPVDRQREFVKIAVNSKFQKLAIEIFSDMD
jgi:hypothetical protein